MTKRAFITGITGQDGYYLTKHLLSLGYEVHGLIRRHSHHETETLRVKNLPVKFHYGDLTDMTSLESALHRAEPHEIYNLAAQSHVKVSFEAPQFTTQVNALGTLNLLEAMRSIVPHSRFYQASTSEMFGNQIDDDLYQRETTPMIPVSPYGASKLFGHNLVHQYRNSYDMFTCSGILFNHESPMRGGNFVTQKTVRAALRIKYGMQDKLELGNLGAHRDWGHADDYVKAMHLMLQQARPDDYVIATGESHSVKEFVEIVFKRIGLDWNDHVVTHPSERRPEDVEFLRGDCSKAKGVLGWVPRYNLESLIDDMLYAEEKLLTAANSAL